MPRIGIIFLALICALDIQAMDTSSLIDDKKALDVLNEKCIRLGTTELVSLHFETACTVLGRNDLAVLVQDEFARTISKSGTVDFPVFEDGPGRYHYTDESGHRTDVTELYRKRTNESTYDVVMLASGRRFFGQYDVIVHLQLVDADAMGVVCSLAVHAYPHNWFTRFSARKIGLVNNYFRDKMRMISYVAREIALGLCERERIRSELQQGLGPAVISADPPPDRSPVQWHNPKASFHSSP